MCGILAVCERSRPVQPDVAARLRDQMADRGPNAAGLYIGGHGRVALGHRRLSILDLSTAANQPMSRGPLHLSFNGEIYNFRELRTELESRGHRFETTSDTEVLLVAWLEWGRQSLERLEGMFGFAIYDDRSETMVLARDRLGIKPVYYAADRDRLVAASQLEPVRQYPGVSTSLDEAAIIDFLTYAYIPAPRTIWREIHKLPPGHVLTWKSGTLHVEPYWKLSINADTGGEASPATLKCVQEELKQRVADSVKAYLVSDVPVGVFLSGGWDSTVVTSTARAVCQNRLRAFSIGFDVRSELPLASEAAKRFGVELITHTVTGPAARQTLERMASLFEEPFAVSSSLPTLFVAEQAAKDVTVVLTGDGGDEVFGGYRWYQATAGFQRPSFWKTNLGKSCCQALNRMRGRQHRAWWLPGLDPFDQYAQLLGAVHREDWSRLLAPDFVERVRDHDPLQVLRNHDRPDLPLMSRLQYRDLMTFLPECCSTKLDRTTMAYHLEARVPLQNHQLVEWYFSLPERVRNPQGRLKGLLKDTFQDRLPNRLRRGRKRGFSAPAAQWFHPRDVVKAYDQLHEAAPDVAARFFAPDFRRRIGNQVGHRSLTWWVLLSWVRQFLAA